MRMRLIIMRVIKISSQVSYHVSHWPDSDWIVCHYIIKNLFILRKSRAENRNTYARIYRSIINEGRRTRVQTRTIVGDLALTVPPVHTPRVYRGKRNTKRS